MNAAGGVANTRDIERTPLPDGSELFRNRAPLGDYPPRITDRLERWADEVPDRTFVAERDGDGWRRITYAQTLRSVRSLAQAFVDLGVSADRGVAVLSENGIDHALAGLAAQYAGVPYAPISPSYSLVAKDFAKLRDVVSNFGPGLVFVDDGERYASGIAAAVPAEVPLVVSRRGGARDARLFADLLETTPGPALERAHALVDAETVAKILYTSGTTGAPKGVTCTQRMLCSNSQMFGRMFPFVDSEPPVLLDWLPWNHTFGGNSNFGVTLYYGGSLYVNDGKPTPALAERTRRNLLDVAPVIYFDVPKGFELLAGFLRDDADLREKFFSRLKMMMYAGAGMSRPIWDELRSLARRTTGKDVLITTSLGSTETGPMALTAPWLADGPGYVGVPVPGIDVKLVPNGTKKELRLRGPSITRGYWRAPELNAKAFDGDGFYCIGDALRFVDPNDAAKGFLFDGRISEDFKLDTGTWVSVGPLRMRALAHFAPLLADAIVSGENRRQIALLAFPDPAACRAVAIDVPAGAPLADVLASRRLRETLVASLSAFAQTATGSATRIERIELLHEPPALDAGEITDKGSLNSRAIFANRATAVERAHADEPASATTIVL